MQLKRKEDTKYHTFMGINRVKIDICKYTKGEMQSLILDIFLKDVKKYGNFAHPCPFVVSEVHILHVFLV